MKKAISILSIAVTAMIVAVYYHTFTWLFQVWLENPDYSHGFLIPFISGYIIWEKRGKLREITFRPSRWGLPVILAGLLLEIISVRSAVNFTSAYSFIIVLLGLALYWGGREMGKELLFPILFLIFMVPFAQLFIGPISYWLKLLSTDLSVALVRVLGIPLYREGVILSVAKGTLEVADPCSGIRSLMSLLMVGAIFVYFAQGPTFKKAILFLITIPLIILGNSFRIFIAVLLLHFHGIIISNTHWETSLGVMVFVIVIFNLMLIGKLLKCQISKASSS